MARPTLEDVQRAHDQLASVLLETIPFDFNGADREALTAQTVVLCWLLDHPHSNAFTKVMLDIDAQAKRLGYRLVREEDGPQLACDEAAVLMLERMAVESNRTVLDFLEELARRGVGGEDAWPESFKKAAAAGRLSLTKLTTSVSRFVTTYLGGETRYRTLAAASMEQLATAAMEAPEACQRLSTQNAQLTVLLKNVTQAFVDDYLAGHPGKTSEDFLNGCWQAGAAAYSIGMRWDGCEKYAPEPE
jgi:hypothetical protein